MTEVTSSKGMAVSKILSSDGVAIAYDRVGQGPPLILVGGAFSYRAFPGLVELAELLSQHFTVINYDRRGRGDSGDTTPYAVEREVDDLDALIRHVGGAASVWGLSSGAVLALRAAAHGLAINRLALYEPPFVVGDSRRPPADHQAQLTRLVAAGRRSAAAKYFMRRVSGVPAVFMVGLPFLPLWSRFKAVAHTLPYDAAVMGDYSLPAGQLSLVTVPTLVIAGERSSTVLRQAAQEVANAVPNARHRSLEGQNHNVSMKALAPVLVEYFKV
ncbi:alpha/beta fold hydrolase [Streptosporangium roseum]|uniref:Alpha/beta hydrolase fold-1 protein n=1 Tax=Streptosporangium roseum (strain ATCC 12428 / DSM 43021 / JCM 3005 / KCTC 9067 / NCIMB 10171 / NRRL 2505 / NI 9100) TaxID=479432 RepID=D2B152_STRRD|nr:alpha/beta hydrolase [Streptosporangium roseum]ACZ83459.1 alpha/beta hydrolase fold-1 protein [Streptosporangium roseum DSM 43021]